jgi:hypothetical protein
MRRIKWLFRFVVDPDVESTNNRAERILRSGVIYRKVSGGMRPIVVLSHMKGFTQYSIQQGSGRRAL